jgi:hypothetical protein
MISERERERLIKRKRKSLVRIAVKTDGNMKTG